MSALVVAGPGATTAMVVQPSPVPGPEDPGGRGEDFGKSSPLGFLVLILFFIAVGFLIRSMTKHLKRVPASFDEPADASDAAGPPADPAAPTKTTGQGQPGPA
jgi:hypothetical protein